MGKSQRIRLSDLRAIYLLVGECCEVGRDPYAWHLRAFESLREVLGARLAFAGMSERRLEDLSYRDVLGTIGWGQMDADGRQATLEYGELDMQRTDPSFLPFLEMKGDLMVRRRRELAPDAQWYRTPHFNEFYRRTDSGDAILMVARPPAATGVRLHHVNLYRRRGDPVFGVRDRRLAHLFFREIRALLGRKLATFGAPNPCGLSPRLREVLALLSDGFSEKQVAGELGISYHTVHDYVKELHKRLGVSSRAELLARGRVVLAPLHDTTVPETPRSPPQQPSQPDG